MGTFRTTYKGFMLNLTIAQKSVVNQELSTGIINEQKIALIRAIFCLRS